MEAAKKTKWARGFIVALFALALALSLVPTFSQTALAEPDDRTEVTFAAGTSGDVDSIPIIGAGVKTPSFVTQTGWPSYINAEGNGKWQKYNAEIGDWEDVDSGTFTAGTWRYLVPIRIDPGDAAQYKFSEGVALEINGIAWTQYGVYNYVDEDNPENNWCNAWFYGPETVLTEGSGPTVVNSVAIENVVLPISGVAPVTAGITTNTTGAVVDSDNTGWGYFDSEDVFILMGSDETFQSGREYALRVGLAPSSDDYVFDAPGYMSPTVNGSDIFKSAWFESAGPEGKYRFLYLFYDAQDPISTSACYIVTAGSLNVRAAASTNSQRLGGLHYGDVIQATGEVGGWVCFDFDGQTGWVNKSYLLLTWSAETAIPPTKYTLTGAGALTVRSYPEIVDGNRIGGLSNGKVITVTGMYTDDNGDVWLIFQYDGTDGPELGFVIAAYMDPVSAEEDTDSDIIKFSAVPHGLTDSDLVWARIAVGDDVILEDENVLDNGDGTYLVTVFPDDAYNYSAITADMVSLPSGCGLVVKSLTLNAEGAVEIVLGPEEGISYTFSKGGNGTWTKGSGKGFELTVNRNVDDDTTFSRFTGIKVDGVALDASNYTAAPGSLEATIDPAYLETLSAGDHTLAVEFDDGTAETTLTVAEESGSGNDGGSGSGSGSNAGGGSGNNSGSTAGTTSGSSSSPHSSTHPRTYDDTNLYLLIGLIVAAAVALGAGFIVRRKRA